MKSQEVIELIMQLVKRTDSERVTELERQVADLTARVRRLEDNPPTMQVPVTWPNYPLGPQWYSGTVTNGGVMFTSGNSELQQGN